MGTTILVIQLSLQIPKCSVGVYI